MKFTKEELNYIIDNYKYKTIKEMATQLNRSEKVIRTKVLKIKKGQCVEKGVGWSYEEVEFLKNNYNKMSNKEIATMLNRSVKSIEVKLARLKLKREPVVYYDKNKFAEIKTESDAYWLGFLYTDGYIYKSKRNTYFGLELQISDIKHLEKLNKYMEGNANIYIRGRYTELGNYHEMCSILFSGKMLVNNLEKLGCVERKSKIVKFPDFISDELIRHFIRGLIDGDGSFGRYGENGYLKVKFLSASQDFINGFSKFLSNKNFKFSIWKDKDTYNIGISGNKNKNAINFLDYIYKDSNIYLDRKYEKYLDLCGPLYRDI